MDYMIDKQIEELMEEAREDVKELRKEVVEKSKLLDTLYEMVDEISYASDVIEYLSAKLATSYYGNGWITDRVPTEEECGSWRGNFLVTVYTDELKTMYMEYEYTTIRGKKIGRWIWCDRVNIPWKVIAWRKLPEPYHQ